MYNSKIYAEEDLAFQRLQQKLYTQQLKGLPDGGLSLSVINGKKYYYKTQNGKRIYLGGAENKEVIQLQKRRFIETSLKYIKKNCTLLEKLIRGYEDIDPEEVMASEPCAYRSPPECCFAMAGIHNRNKWGDADYNKYMGFPEGLKHKTLKGEKVRSKSEALIANLLFVKDIQYHYEEIKEIGGETIPPDFTIYVKSQKSFKLLEHLGLLVDEEYRNRALNKMELYFKNGYRMYEDILFTCDDLSGCINTQDISRLIDTYCT